MALNFFDQIAGENDSEAEDSLEHPVKFRVCILGHTGTGKTSLVNQVLTSEYMNAYDTSLGKLHILLAFRWVKSHAIVYLYAIPIHKPTC